MKYKDLLGALMSCSVEALNQDVTVKIDDEYVPIVFCGPEEYTDVLDKGHLVLHSNKREEI